MVTALYIINDIDCIFKSCLINSNDKDLTTHELRQQVYQKMLNNENVLPKRLISYLQGQTLKEYAEHIRERKIPGNQIVLHYIAFALKKKIVTQHPFNPEETNYYPQYDPEVQPIQFEDELKLYAYTQGKQLRTFPTPT